MSAAYTALAGTLKARSGLTLGPDKLYLLETRLAPLLRREGLRNLEELAARLKPDSPLEGEMVEAMTTNESLFFRDAKPFDLLRHTILPRLHATRRPGATLRIWSAAAATGQEAYSIAMICADLATTMPNRSIELVGTDIAREPLDRARQGLYSQFEIQRGLPMQMLVRYFDKEDAHYRVKPALREAVRFRFWNLLADPTPLGRFDVIFCRNVLIYFDADTKRRVLENLSHQLQPEGALFLGSTETMLGITDRLHANPHEAGSYRAAR